MKRCTACKLEKDESLFGKLKTVKSGLASRCKICVEIYRKEYKSKNPERFKELCKAQKQKHYKNNKETVLKKNKIWYEENRENVLEKQKEYAKKRYLEKKEQITERNNVWRKNNPHKFLEIQNRYPEKRSARRSISYAIARGLMTKPSTCTRCSLEGYIEGHHPDYQKPLEVIWLCRECHNKEHGKHKRTK